MPTRIADGMAEAAARAGFGVTGHPVETPPEEPEGSEPLEGGTEDNTEEVGPEPSSWPESVPESYMGTDLKGVVPPEAAEDYYKVLKEQERVVNRRLADIAEARKTATETPAPLAQQVEPEADEPLSIEDQLRALGADPDLINEVGLMPLAAKLLELDNTVTTANTSSQAQEWERDFHSKLDALEQENGKLPQDRDSILEYAIDQDIYSPAALYWSIAGPLKISVAKEMEKRAKAAEGKTKATKKAISSIPRAGSSSGSTSAPSKFQTILEAFEQAKKG